MGIFRSSGKFIYKTFLDVPTWIGWGTLKVNTKNLIDMTKDILVVKKVDEETFEQAKKRLNLTEKDIERAKNYYVKFSMLFLAVTVLSLIYTFYLFLSAYFLSGVIAFLVTVLSALESFMFHFRYFQIKHRKLGCTIKEWFSGEIKVIK